jgi:hypothetical protein
MPNADARQEIATKTVNVMSLTAGKRASETRMMLRQSVLDSRRICFT